MTANTAWKYIQAGALFMLLVVGAPVTLAQTSATQIGGPYQLKDHRGQPATDKSYLGKLQIITFGYTFCPDVCPTTLTTLADILDLLGTDNKQLQPIFITLDPARDNTDVLAGYVSYFHLQLIGLTGTEQQIKAVAVAYQVQFRRVNVAGDDGYHIEHSAVHYLVDKTGTYIGHLQYDVAPEAAAKAIKELLRQTDT